MMAGGPFIQVSRRFTHTAALMETGLRLEKKKTGSNDLTVQKKRRSMSLRLPESPGSPTTTAAVHPPLPLTSSPTSIRRSSSPTRSPSFETVTGPQQQHQQQEHQLCTSCNLPVDQLPKRQDSNALSILTVIEQGRDNTTAPLIPQTVRATAPPSIASDIAPKLFLGCIPFTKLRIPPLFGKRKEIIKDRKNSKAEGQGDSAGDLLVPAAAAQQQHAEGTATSAGEKVAPPSVSRMQNEAPHIIPENPLMRSMEAILENDEGESPIALTDDHHSPVVRTASPEPLTTGHSPKCTCPNRHSIDSPTNVYPEVVSHIPMLLLKLLAFCICESKLIALYVFFLLRRVLMDGESSASPIIAFSCA